MKLIRVVSLTACLVALNCAIAVAQVVPRSDRVLPDTTVGYISVGNWGRLKEHWNKTQIGKLMADPVMQRFTDDLRRQFEERFSAAQHRLGVKLEDLKGVPGGEVAAAVIRPGVKQAAVVIFVDVTGNLDRAESLLQKITKHQLDQGAKQRQHAIRGVEVRVFDLPRQEPQPDAARTIGTAGEDEEDEAAVRTAAYFLKDNLLVVSDDVRAIEGIIDRLTGQQLPCLADLPAYKAVMSRCQRDAPKLQPQIRWFLHPVFYADAARAATPPERRGRGKSAFEVLLNQGFTAIQGVGGFVDFAAEGFELVHRTAVYAPKPYHKAMSMLLFPPGSDYAPQAWVPREVATYTTFYVDLVNAFDNVGSLADELLSEPQFLFTTAAQFEKDLAEGQFPPALRKEFAENRIRLGDKFQVSTRIPGEVWEIRDLDKKNVFLARKVIRKLPDGKREPRLRIAVEVPVWEEILQGLKTGANGPQIDLREEFIAHLGQRVSILTDYQTPITVNSERLLFAIEVRDEKAVLAGLAKLLDPDIKAKTAVKRQFGNYTIWEFVQDESATPPPPIVAIPSIGKVPSEDPQPQPKLLPTAAITVAHGQLMIASHIDFLYKVLKPTEAKKTLVNDLDFKKVTESIEGFALPGQCARSFSLTDEEYYVTYELIRQNKFAGSNMLLARLLSSFSGAAQKAEPRKGKFDGSSLPDYSVVRKSLGPAGMVVSSQEDGWFIKGFTCTKEP